MEKKKLSITFRLLRALGFNYSEEEIGDYTIVGAGAVVAKTLPAKCTAVGVPAKPIKFHES